MKNLCPKCGCPPRHTVITARVKKDLATGKLMILRKLEGEEQDYQCGGGHLWKESDRKVITTDRVEEDD